MQNISILNLPKTETKYIQKISIELKSLLKKDLIAIYIFGSVSYGGYIAGISDLDLQIVTKNSLSPDLKRKIVSKISNKTIPCPAKKLEFVSYPLKSLNPVDKNPEFDINLNTGVNIDDHICFDFTKEPGHWFLLDIAIGRESGTSLHGPAPVEVFGEVPKRWIIEAMIKCIDWYIEEEPDSPDLVLNACRSWKFLETGIMSSKQAGIQWALLQNDCPKVLEKALHHKQEGKDMSLEFSLEFIDFIKNKLKSNL